jgi:hypothetical protein
MMSKRKISLVVQTVRFLQPKQLIYFIYYAVLRKVGLYTSAQVKANNTVSITQPVIVKPVCISKDFYQDNNNTFTFLNRSTSFGSNIDWNYSSFGKLWTYNLNYFEFLFQANMTAETGLQLIRDYINKLPDIKDGLEPYCISVRTIQWIKFLGIHQINDSAINNVIQVHINLLAKRIEYHLMANHVLENAYALTVGAWYLKNKELYARSRELLLAQLKEQILEDGAHYERCPMYQVILLNRLLDVINLTARSVADFNQVSKLNDQLRVTATKMLGWLGIMQVHGQLPAFHDSTNVLNYGYGDVLQYAMRLNIKAQANIILKDSAYRKLAAGYSVIIADVGSASPSYQPGHAHASALSFILYCKDNPVLVDPGISTYENCARRLEEKSTSYHNTVSIRNANQSEIWASFRIGKRAKTKVIKDDIFEVAALHDGYRFLSIDHQRTFTAKADHFFIKDELFGKNEDKSGVLHFHFHPDRIVNVNMDKSSILIDNYLHITFSAHNQLFKSPYYFADDFNSVREAVKISIHFDCQITTKIEHLK